MARTNTEVVSLLPLFKARRSEDYPSWAIVTCPREDCGHDFLVNISNWFKSRVVGVNKTLVTGRPCPYCFKAARLPARSRIR